MANNAAPKTYRTARGVMIDMNKLATRNELTPAVGNMKVNARGDKLGNNGQVIRAANTDTTNGIIVPEQNNTPVVNEEAPIIPSQPKIVTPQPTIVTPPVQTAIIASILLLFQ